MELTRCPGALVCMVSSWGCFQTPVLGEVPGEQISAAAGWQGIFFAGSCEIGLLE